MSELQFIQQLEHTNKMQFQQSLLKKEVFNSKKAALNRGLSPNYVCLWARRLLFLSNKPNNFKCLYKRRDLHNWLLAIGKAESSPISEAEKMAILNPERG